MTRFFIRKCLIMMVVTGLVLFIQGLYNVPRENKEQSSKTSECNCKQEGLSNAVTNNQVAKNQQMTKNDRVSYFNAIQRNRTKNVFTECSKIKHMKKYDGTLGEDRLKAHMIYDESTMLVFCDLPKVGSTFLKQTLHILTGHRKVKNPHEIKGEAAHAIPFNTFNKVAYDKIISLLLDSTKFLFVRNPYTRILSGYVDKLYTNNFVFWETVGKTVIKQHRKNADNTSLDCGHNTSFFEFIKFVINSETTLKHRNPHWYPMYDACRPCRLHYDVIGRIESFKEDLDLFLHSKNLSNMVNLSSMNEGNDNEAISLTVDRVFEAVKMKPKCLTVLEAFKRAWNVLQIRGIISHSSEFPSHITNKIANFTNSKFQEIIKNEIKQHPMTLDDKTLVREQIITKAYGSLSKKDLKTFQDIFHPDFALFSYKKSLPPLNENFIKWKPFSVL